MSSTLRQQIGIAKRQLLRALEEANREQIELSKLQTLTDDELLNIYEGHTCTHDSLFRTYSRIYHLWNEWQKLMTVDPQENQILEEYVTKYGDFRQTLEDAVNTLQRLDQERPLIESELERKSISFEPYESDADSLFSENVHSRRHQATTLPLAPTPTPLNNPQQPTNQASQQAQSNISFVDASILSKLDLPTFEGNLLEFPEYWARFSTLVGDKPQLDGATKFSLLKSTLRGKALQIIKGLAITAANYPIAVEILKNHFDDHVTTRHILYTRLASLPVCDKDGRHLFAIYSQMYALVRQFTTYEDDSKEYALGAILLNKLPRHIRSRIYDENKNQENLIPTELLKILTKIVKKETTLQEMETHFESEEKHTFYVSSRPHSRQPQTTRNAFRSRSSSRNKCPFCLHNSHNSFNCNVYPTASTRIEIVKKNGLCYNCLSALHITKNCPSKRRCSHCTQMHHTSLCLKRPTSFLPSTTQSYPTQNHDVRRNNNATSFQRTQNPIQNVRGNNNSYNRTREVAQTISQQRRIYRPTTNHVHFSETEETEVADAQPHTDTQPQTDTQPEITTILHTSQETSRRRPHLLCVDVLLFNPEDNQKQTKVMALLDTGASQTYITNEIVKALQLRPSPSRNLDMYTFGSETPITIQATEHLVGLFCKDNTKPILRVQAIPLLTKQMKWTVATNPKSTTTLATKSSKPGILIGMDYLWDLVFSNDFYITAIDDGLRILHTRIGEIVADNTFRYDHTSCLSLSNHDDTNMANPQHHSELLKLVEKFWNNESMGIIDDPNENDNEKCLEDFYNSVIYKKEERRYSVKLPFKVSPSELPSNKDIAFSRLLSNVKTLQKNPAYMEKYHAIFTEQLQRNIIEEVDENTRSGQCHYLAHHGVITESKKHTKIRCVFDGSAKKKGFSSLNEVLSKGPNLLPDLLGILLRARTAPILITGDIEKAFLMVELQNESRDFTRFFWLKDPAQGTTKTNVIIYRFRRVPFGLISSPFLLAATIHYHLTTTNTPLASNILRNTYVDNVFYGASSLEDGKNFYTNSKNVFNDAGMNLRDYSSNNQELNRYIAEKEGCKADDYVKILGIGWNTVTDELDIKIPTYIANDPIWTKRRVLQKVASIYDPFGWISPATLTGKIFLQKLWMNNLSWDQALPDHLNNEWTTIIKSWNTPSIKCPRHMLSEKTIATKYEIHVFTDASQDAYAAVSYLIETNGHQRISSSLLVAKSRLSSKKPRTTIPKLELMALTIGAKLIQYLRTQLDLPIDKEFIWCDSKVALDWTNTTKELPVFVRNRVRTIKETASNAKFLHVPGSINPADVASRGCTIDDLLQNQIWWNGPQFLLQEESLWVQNHQIDLDTPQITLLLQPSLQHPPPVITSERFSTWKHLLQTMTHVISFICRVSPAAAKIFGANKLQICNKAEIVLYRMAQLEDPPNEELIQQLRLFWCNSMKLYRVHTRIQNSALPTETTNPILLPRKSRITSLYINYIHAKNLHCGTEQTLIELRKSVWIPKGRTTVKHAINTLCFHCKKSKAKSFKLPDFPLLPHIRVNRPAYPFENTGMDILGPLHYKDDTDIIQKCWILLWTCLNCRAITVDILRSLSSNSFLHSLRRFIATNGHPRRIICDNATTFTAFAKAQSDEITTYDPERDVMDYCDTNKIKFKFIPAFSPWQGGVYERMIGLFKNAIKHALNNKTLQFDELHTLAKEAEAICNSRPLTYVNEQPDFMPLRPIDFIRPTALLSGPHLIDEDDEWKPTYTTRDNLIQNWKFGLQLLDKFWKRWSNEYLTSLRERHQLSHPHPRSYEEDHPHHGEFVLIKDDSLKRGQWRLGQICGSHDGYQRSVQIQLPSKKVITRPLNLVSRFEIDTSNDSSSTTDPCNDSPSKTTTKSNTDTSDDSSSTTDPCNNSPSKTTTKTNTHPMMTRSKTRQQSRHSNFTCISLALMALTLISQAAANSKCTKEINTPKKVLYTTACASEGAAVAIYTSNEKEDLCWFPVQCPNGDIQPISTSNSQLCGPKCKCPNWSQFCSHYKGHRTTHSTFTNLPSHLKNFTPKEVCAFQSTSSCHPQKRLGSFNQIELYDQTRLIVPNLNVRIKDYIDSTDFICIDTKGEISSNDPPFKGTSFFCEKQRCNQHANKLCLYDKPIALYDLDSSNHSDYMIPIKAWGTVIREYYPHPSQGDTRNNKIRITCAKGGLKVHSSITIDTLEACISSYCIYAKHISEMTILFPTELVIFTYASAITAWTDGLQIYNSSVSCSAQPICEILDCTLCLEYVLNAQCWDFRSLLLIAISCVMITVTCWTIIPLVILTKRMASILLRIIKFAGRTILRIMVFRRLRTNTHPTPTPITPYRKPKRERRRERSSRHLLTLASVIIFVSHFNIVTTCSEVITMTSTIESCSRNGENETCSFDQGTILALQPLGQEVCLSMRNYQNESIGLIVLRIKGIHHVCNKKIEFFTRDHEFQTESSHRCYWAGSCKKGVCDNTKTSDKIEELSNKANRHPGFSFCTPSCQCCDGCFWCTPSCLFYRYFAVPTSETIYTVFKCPTWELTVSAEIILQTQDRIQTHSVILHPGRTVAIDDIKFSLIDTTTPQLPILASTFIEDGKRTAQIMQAQANQLIAQTPAQLQCSSFDDAKRFKCRFAPNTCTCSSGTSKTSCVCAEGKIAPYTHQNTLPLITKLVTIKKVGKTLQAHTQIGSSIQVRITMNNFKLTTTHTKDKCSITSSAVRGCYSCILGAKIDLNCHSSETDTTADILCAQQLQIASCSKQGRLNTLTFHFDHSNIYINCTVVCPGGNSTFLLQGVLDYVNDQQLQKERDVEDEKQMSHSNVLQDIYETTRSWISDFLAKFNFLKYLLIACTLIPLIILFYLITILFKRSSVYKKYQ